jgi:hypothetical protein
MMGKQYFFYGDCTGCLRPIKSYKDPLKALEEYSAVDESGPIYCFCIDKTKGGSELIGCIEATSLLREFARKCALDVIHLWDAPAIVKEYLETGKEELRAAAWAAAGDAAWAAAGDAARAAAWAAQNKRLAEMLLLRFESINGENHEKASSTYQHGQVS